VGLHLAVLLFVPGCGVAAWWQITRATDGNGLSYLYAIEWPIFAVLGVYFWWMFIHTDYDTVGLKGMRNRERGTMSPASPTPMRMPSPATPAVEVEVEVGVGVGVGVDDPELAAYNARLSALATTGPKTWRSPEHTVVRRHQPS
jgi:hypothetical protein